MRTFSCMSLLPKRTPTNTATRGEPGRRAAADNNNNNNNNNNNKGWGTPGAYLTLAVFLQLGEPAPTTFVARISNIGVQNVVGAKKHIAGCRTLSSIGHEIMALWPHIWRGPV